MDNQFHFALKKITFKIEEYFEFTGNSLKKMSIESVNVNLITKK